MARLLARGLILFILAVGGLAATASAQSMKMIKVDVPFEFNFGDHAFPAGTYTLVQARQHFLSLRDAQGRTIAQLFTQGIESNNPADSTRLKFDFSEGQHRLIEVWREQDSAGERLYQSKVQTIRAKRHPVEDSKTAQGGQP
jgi:hypothetical protein